MASLFTHAVVAGALGQAAPKNTRCDWRFWYLVILCAVLPDVDVVGFYFGIQYGDLWGHRGLTHSLLFAVLLGLAVAARYRVQRGGSWGLMPLFIVVTMTHGLLDALTNGGLGVAFFSPFNPTRYFFPWNPIEVSPIGAVRFFSSRGIAVLKSEFFWVWVPSAGIALLLNVFRRRLRHKSSRPSTGKQ